MRHRSYVLSSLLAGLLASVPACGDDEEGDDNHSEEELDGDCKEISDACHHVDEGEGEILACHELAHENDVAACSAQVESCTTACAEHGH